MSLLRAAFVAAAWLLHAHRLAALRVQQQSGDGAGLSSPQKEGVEFTASRRMLRPGIVHFMFELKDHLQHPAIWGKFFSQAMQGSYMAWAHCTDQHACENDWMMKRVKVRLVPQVFSKRGSDLVSPFAHMIRIATAETRAFAEKGIPEKFVVISDATLPVKPFSYIHWDLMSRPESDICISVPRQWAKAEIAGEPLALVKHHQWLALNRADGLALANDWDPVPKAFTWNMTLKTGRWAKHPVKVNRKRFTGGAWFSATDEEAVYERIFGPMFLKSMNDTQSMWDLFDNRTCLTYVDWPDNVWPKSALEPHMTTSLLQTEAEAGHTYNFTNDVTLQLLRDENTKFSIATGVMHPFMVESMGDVGLSVFRRSQYLFARKFSSCAHMPNFTEIMFSE